MALSHTNDRSRYENPVRGLIALLPAFSFPHHATCRYAQKCISQANKQAGQDTLVQALIVLENSDDRSAAIGCLDRWTNVERSFGVVTGGECMVSFSVPRVVRLVTLMHSSSRSVCCFR